MHFLVPFAIAGLAGGAQAVSIAEPLGGQPLWWLQLLSLSVLAALLQAAASWKRAAWLGWTFATVWLAGTFWWLFISMHTYGGLAAPLAVLAVFALAGFLSSYYAVAAGLFRGFAGRHRVPAALHFAGLWLAAELARVTWFTGFPWGEGGYAHVDGPLAFLAPWIGVHGMSFVAALLAFALAQLAQPGRLRSWRSWTVVAATVALLAACNMVGPRELPPGQAGRFRVALLQGAIPQDEKFEGGTGIPLALEWYGQQLLAAPAPLVVAPETAIPLLPSQLPEGYLDALRSAFGTGRAALVGIPLGGFEEGYTNSVLGLRAGAADYRYHKHHLVPFGEFIPPLFKWFVRMMNIPLGDFDRGAVGQPSFEWQGQLLAPNICYEDLFGEELGARFIDAARAPTAFVNLSNIAWFGDSVAIDQHLQISRMRALEFERPMLRATNTGATVIIDHRGRVTHALPRLQRGVLLGEVEGRQAITPYAWWVARFGLWPLWLLAAAVVALACRGRERGGPR